MAPVKRPVVLFVLQWSLHAIGGVNHVVTHLAQQMRDAGEYEPMVLMADWEATEPVFEEIHGLRTLRWQVRAWERNMGIKARLGYALWERRFRKQFADFCREHAVCAVNLHYPGPAAFTFERLLKTAAPQARLLLSFHGSDVGNLAGLDTAQKEDWRGLMMRCAAVVACSRELATRIETALGTAVPCQVIYNGVDADRFAAALAQERPPRRQVILHVGLFERNKGQDVLIDAFARIANAFPDTVLHLVGGSGSSLEQATTAAQRIISPRQSSFCAVSRPARLPTSLPWKESSKRACGAAVFNMRSKVNAAGPG